MRKSLKIAIPVIAVIAVIAVTVVLATAVVVSGHGAPKTRPSFGGETVTATGQSDPTMPAGGKSKLQTDGVAPVVYDTAQQMFHKAVAAGIVLDHGAYSSDMPEGSSSFNGVGCDEAPMFLAADDELVDVGVCPSAGAMIAEAGGWPGSPVYVDPAGWCVRAESPATLAKVVAILGGSLDHGVTGS